MFYLFEKHLSIKVLEVLDWGKEDGDTSYIQLLLLILLVEHKVDGKSLKLLQVTPHVEKWLGQSVPPPPTKILR